ncbi:MAG: phage tail tape measure protein, partial [Litorimonas sp.]
VALGTRTLSGAAGVMGSVREQERNRGRLRSLSASHEEIDSMQAIMEPIAKEFAYIEVPDMLGAAYDVRSALGTLDAESQATITAHSAVLARATDASASEITDLATTAHGMFKDQMPDATDIEWMTDFGAIMASSVEAFKTTGPKMQQAFMSAGATAASVGFTMEEYAAILGAGQKTMKGGQIGTGFRAYSGKLREAQETFDEQGLDIQLIGDDGKRARIEDVIEDITGLLGEDWTVDDMGVLKDAFPDVEALNFLVAMRDANDEYKKGLALSRQARELGEESFFGMARRQDDNADADMQKTIEALRDIKRSLGYSLVSVFKDALPTIQAVTDRLTAFIDEHPRLMKYIAIGVVLFGVLAATMGGLALTIGSLIAPIALLRYSKILLFGKAKDGARSFQRLRRVAGGLGTGLGRLAKGGMGVAVKGLRVFRGAALGLARVALPAVMTALRALSLALISTPIGWLIAGVALVATAAFLIYKHWGPIRDFFARLWGGIGARLSRAWSILGTVLSWSPLGVVLRAWRPMLDWLKSLWPGLPDGAKGAVAILRT